MLWRARATDATPTSPHDPAVLLRGGGTMPIYADLTDDRAPVGLIHVGGLPLADPFDDDAGGDGRSDP